MKVLAFVIAWALAVPALACDAVDCTSAPIALPKTDNVPINAFVFEVTGSNTQGLRLTDVASSEVIPASVKWAGPDQVWSPDAALQLGQQVRVSYRTACAVPSEQTRTFFVAPAASFDQAPGVQVIEKYADAPHGERRIYASVSYQPPSSAENYLRLRIEVDGLPHASSSYYAPYAFGELREQLWARCDVPPNPDTTCGGYDSLTARRHEVKLIAHALGEREEHTQTIDVDLRCEVKSKGCQLGATQGGAWALLALLLRRRRR
ncbi:MAG TPA: hypothetical protein VFX59_23620 [Polyangiales bacterium]|nr:hypothetical protein [Polyangiales bacterium]